MKNLKKLCIITVVISFLMGFYWASYLAGSNDEAVIDVDAIDKDLLDDLEQRIEQIFTQRNRALLLGKAEMLNELYDKELRNSLWAYEYEVKKIRYLNSWSTKQGVDFKTIDSEIIVRNKEVTEEKIGINLLVSTEYKYTYDDQPDKENSFRLGTYHVLDLKPVGDSLEITKEWYNNPLASYLQMDSDKRDQIREKILAREAKDLEDLSEPRKKALEYANRYLGAATPPRYEFKYNKDYKNYNYQGGDCTNFASQVIYESGSFSKDYTWNYKAGSGSKAWVNANAFNQYMIHNQKANLLASGSYQQVLESSYKLLPGDYIAYGDSNGADHISVVSGIDSKGYALVNSHNSDRYKVPWDIGWNEKGAKFWLVRVNY